MKKYDSYKDSGVEWIGEIPIHWEETRLRFVGDLFGGLTGKSGDDFKQDDNPNNKPYIPYTNIFRNTYISKEHVDYVVIESGENQNKVKKYDLFFLMSSETHQDLGKPCILIDDVEELYLNSFCKGFRVKREDVYPLFLNYQLLGGVHKELISIEGRGFTRINLRQDRLNDTPILLPPLSEQQKIVSYLDTKTSLIDSLIEKTQRKIELLKENRTSLINEVVTKGLNPNVEMKDSGVEWIGDIPSHWSLIKTYLISENLDGKRVPLNSEERGDVQGEIPYWGSGGIVDYINKYIFDEELLLVGEDGSPFFDSYRDVSFYVNEKIWVNNHIHILRSKKEKVLTKFLVHSFNSVDYKEYITGSTRDKLTQTDLNRITHPVPPLSEQEQIVSYLDEHTQLIDKTISLEERRIELLKEYRQSLISEVVTGKRKVVKDE